MSYPPPPAYPPAPGSEEAGQVRLRGRTPRLLGWIFLAVAGAALVAGWIVNANQSFGKGDGFQRVSFASGAGTVNLDGTGKWVGYYEASNVSSSISFVPNFRIEMTAPSGVNVNLENYGNRSDGSIKKLTYDYNGHKGVAAFQFTARQAGQYQIRLQDVGSLPPDANVAIGRDIAGGTMVGALLIVVGVLFLIAAIVLLIVGFVKRSRHKKELQSGPKWGTWGAPAPAYGGAPQPYPPPPGYGDPHQPPPGYGAQAPPPGYGKSQPPPAGEPEQR